MQETKSTINIKSEPATNKIFQQTVWGKKNALGSRCQKCCKGGLIAWERKEYRGLVITGGGGEVWSVGWEEKEEEEGREQITVEWALTKYQALLVVSAFCRSSYLILPTTLLRSLQVKWLRLRELWSHFP